MNLLCPRCGQPIASHDVNIQANLAKCTPCDTVFKASDLVEAREISQDMDLPSGSSIQYKSAGMGISSLSIPAQGLKVRNTFPIIFATFWIGFVAFWTLMAAQGSILFALFSIPFWFVGLFMWIGIVRAATEKQTLSLDGEGIEITKTAFMAQKRVRIAFDDIDLIKREGLSLGAFQFGGNTGGSPAEKDTGGVATIHYGVNRIQVGEFLSQAERDWLYRVLKTLILLKGRR